MAERSPCRRQENLRHPGGNSSRGRSAENADHRHWRQRESSDAAGGHCGPRDVTADRLTADAITTGDAGRVIEIHDGVRQIKGVTRGLNALGALRVETDGKIEEIYSGDVISWQ